MSIRVKQFLIVSGILAVAELGSFAWLASRGDAFSPFINIEVFFERPIETLQGYGFDEIDPLLGWGMSEKTLIARGFELHHGMPVLRTDGAACEDTLRILVTGGSTTDVALLADNWPAHLMELLEQRGICCTLHMGAVGGYASGQELLKLIRDGRHLKLDIHLSYSGANETSHPYLVSEYETDLYQRMMSAQASSVFPNLVFLIRSQLLPWPTSKLHHAPLDGPQWTANMDMMQAIAIGRGYTFVGVLQPVLGVGKVVQPEQEKSHIGFVKQYREFYPTALADLEGRPYLVNMTALFDTVKGPVYIDDCHLRPEAQPVVAQAILRLILANRDTSHIMTVNAQ